jgi:hypothetical protein
MGAAPQHAGSATRTDVLEDRHGGLVDPQRRVVDPRVEIGVVRPGIADADHGAAVEDEVAEALGLQPRAVEESVEILTAGPVATAQWL